MGIGRLLPIQELADQHCDPARWRRHMQEFSTPPDANVAGAQLPGMINKPRHEQPVRLKQVVQAMGFPAPDGFVGEVGIAYLEDLLWTPENRLAIQDRCHLLHAQSVLLDRERRLERPDSVAPTKFRAQATAVGCLPRTQLLRDTGHQSRHAVREVEWRLIGRHGCGIEYGGD